MVSNKIILAIAAFAFSINAFASDLAKKASVEKLLAITEVSKTIDTIYAQIDSMSTNMAMQMGLTEENRPAFDKYMKKVNAVIREDMNWEKMKEPMIQVYMKHFTEQEIQGMIEFYNSDVGKSSIKKMPLVMQDSMGVSQKLMEGVFPKIKALADELSAEVKASKTPTEPKK